eukprot:TRINITY_DN9317_c0_g1_i3.p1 TRINITY_DN9317_c0_g1~~TRINITY_DN9317_c0_g1_i3.p1  ORF type:complete len:390 (+),score=64.42 TRINITY_DN9317_c0_g1_i3:55-1224(+)
MTRLDDVMADWHSASLEIEELLHLSKQPRCFVSAATDLLPARGSCLVTRARLAQDASASPDARELPWQPPGTLSALRLTETPQEPVREAWDAPLTPGLLQASEEGVSSGFSAGAGTEEQCDRYDVNGDGVPDRGELEHLVRSPSWTQDESDEECTWAPGSPTERQGSDLTAAKPARQGTQTAPCSKSTHSPASQNPFLASPIALTPTTTQKSSSKAVTPPVFQLLQHAQPSVSPPQSSPSAATLNSPNFALTSPHSSSLSPSALTPPVSVLLQRAQKLQRQADPRAATGSASSGTTAHTESLGEANTMALWLAYSLENVNSRFGAGEISPEPEVDQRAAPIEASDGLEGWLHWIQDAKQLFASMHLDGAQARQEGVRATKLLVGRAPKT